MLLCLTFTLNEQILEFCSDQKQYKIELFPSKQRIAKKKQKYNYFVLLNLNFIFFFGFVVDLIQLTQLYKLVLELNISLRFALTLGPRLDFEYILADAVLLMIVVYLHFSCFKNDKFRCQKQRKLFFSLSFWSIGHRLSSCKLAFY